MPGCTRDASCTLEACALRDGLDAWTRRLVAQHGQYASDEIAPPCVRPPLPQRQLEILQHAIGADKHGQGGGHRNHFCAGGADEDDCRELVKLGYMRLWSGADPETGRMAGYPYYNCSVTEQGRQVIAQESPAPPKLTRDQKRYRDFLRQDTGMSFREWLKAGGWRKPDPLEFKEFGL